MYYPNTVYCYHCYIFWHIHVTSFWFKNIWIICVKICQQNFHVHHREPIRHSYLSQTAYCLLVYTVVQSSVIHIQCSVTLAALWHCIWQSVTNEFYSQTWWYDAVMYKESWTKLVTFMAFLLEKGIITCWFSASMVTSDVCNANKSNL